MSPHHDPFDVAITYLLVVAPHCDWLLTSSLPFAQRRLSGLSLPSSLTVQWPGGGVRSLSGLREKPVPDTGSYWRLSV